MGGGTRLPIKPKPNLPNNRQIRHDDDPPPLLSILRQRQCLPLLLLRLSTMSLLPPSLPLSAPSLPPQPQQQPQPQPQLKPQWRQRWRRRRCRLVTLDCIGFGVIENDGVGHAPEGHRAQELGVQWLIHQWGHGQKQRKSWRCDLCYPTPPCRGHHEADWDDSEDAAMEEDSGVDGANKGGEAE